MVAVPTAPLAYSYLRFSSPAQASGDSLRRQIKATADWCERNGVVLDTSLTLRDCGVSAFKGKHRTNPDRSALAAFLKLVEQSKVPRGSYLIVENLDRLSREDIQPALLLALGLLQAGIRIVQLRPAELVFDDKSDTLPVMMMMVELSRGHSESKLKSDRVSAAREEERRRAREDGVIIAQRLPAWVEERAGKLCLIPERAAVVKRIFEMAASGYGLTSIVKRLTLDNVPGFGACEAAVDPETGKPRQTLGGRPKRHKARGERFGSGRWNRAYVALILSDRRALGEIQPYTVDGKPAGEPIKGYFPAAVGEDAFNDARDGARERRCRWGRISKAGVNVFAGLLLNARDGDRYHCTLRVAIPSQHRAAQRVLINGSAVEGRTTYYSFPFDTFEAAILSLLREIDPHAVLNGDSGPDESLALAGELARLEGRIAELEVELESGAEVAAAVKVLRKLEGQKRDLAAKLAEARQKAANPLSESWGEAQSLMAALDAAPDPEDARLRLRSALRRIVESIWLLVVPRGKDRLCAVQVWFTGGDRHRDYLVLHRAAVANGNSRTPCSWWARSLAHDAVPGELDLRDRTHAERLAKVLASLPLH
jgi:DNA invertase Pin-like site-specific DNA recombinase